MHLTTGDSQIFLASKAGLAIRFEESKARPMGRTAAGVRGMRLTNEGDELVGMICMNPEDVDETILVISEKGMGKRSDFNDYRLTNRGGKGVRTIMITDKTGPLVAMKAMKDDSDLMITSKSGVIIRMNADNIRVMGRATQGVKLIRLDAKDQIADVAVVAKDESINEEEE